MSELFGPNIIEDERNKSKSSNEITNNISTNNRSENNFNLLDKNVIEKISINNIEAEKLQKNLSDENLLEIKAENMLNNENLGVFLKTYSPVSNVISNFRQNDSAFQLSNLQTFNTLLENRAQINQTNNSLEESRIENPSVSAFNDLYRKTENDARKEYKNLIELYHSPFPHREISESEILEKRQEVAQQIILDKIDKYIGENYGDLNFNKFESDLSNELKINFLLNQPKNELNASEITAQSYLSDYFASPDRYEIYIKSERNYLNQKFNLIDHEKLEKIVSRNKEAEIFRPYMDKETLDKIDETRNKVHLPHFNIVCLGNNLSSVCKDFFKDFNTDDELFKTRSAELINQLLEIREDATSKVSSDFASIDSRTANINYLSAERENRKYFKDEFDKIQKEHMNSVFVNSFSGISESLYEENRVTLAQEIIVGDIDRYIGEHPDNRNPESLISELSKEFMMYNLLGKHPNELSERDIKTRKVISYYVTNPKLHDDLKYYYKKAVDEDKKDIQNLLNGSNAFSR